MTNVVAFTPAAHKFIPLSNHTAEIIRFVPSSRRMHPLLAEAMASNEFSPIVKRQIAEVVKSQADEMDATEAACIFYLAEYWSTENTQQMGA